MTRVGFIGDVHVANHKKFGGQTVRGVNKRCEHVVRSLQSATTIARVQNVESLVILGDLFDTPKPAPQIIRRVQEVLECIPTIILAGNHDQSSDSAGDNALAPLYPVAEVIDSPDIVGLEDLNLIMVPYHSGHYATYLKEEVTKLCGEARRGCVDIVCFHAGVADERTPSFLRDSQASITRDKLFDLLDETGARMAFAGHWHNARAWARGEKDIFQAGAFVPTGFGDQGVDYGTLYIYDTETGIVEYHPIPGPRFLDVTLDQDVQMLAAQKNERLEGCSLFIRIAVDETEVALGETIIKAGIDADVIEDGELTISKEATKKACEGAAVATNSADNLEEALNMYTGAMPLKGIDPFDEPEARMEILSMAIEYLRKTGAD
jgi:DNA repair exonuclease SbcCD nuclease subunit